MPTSSSPVPHLNLSSSFSPQSVQPQYYPIQSPVPSSGSIPFRQITREQFEQLSPEDKARYVSSYQQLCVQQASWFTWQQQQFQLYPQTNIWGQQNPYASQSPVPMNFAASSSGTNSLSNFDNQAHPPLKGPDRSSLFTEYTGMPHILPTDYKVVHTQQQSGSLNSRNLQEPPSAFYQTHNAVIAASAPPPKLPTQKDNSQTNSSSFKSYHTETIFSSEIMPQPVYHIPEPCFGAQPEKYLEPSHSKPSQPNYQLSPSATTSVSPASPSSSPLPQATASVHLQSSPPNLTQGPPPTDQFKPLFPSTSPFTIEFHKHKDLPKDEKLTQKMIYFWYKISEMFTPDLLGSSFYPSIFQKSKLQTTTSEDSDRTPRRYENIFFNVIKLPRDDIPVNKEDDSI
ncbi:uncharacterized protein MONOS_8573 [Monocercomonoides exilis]|uniref:uncharacterized protein n=1 Tax=Monocercomonoides exilis TaxID=2049356 RepID=UPI00355A1613|nr:hypothetical protein MONOS_8573 [Monocercomonoides exilis]|eukprot:MONOS_8573.1-p1 / transcript=MONOS_8573.1 / gene=MONOS_8573 / organism=Monocercomonoides_exilis_PA203 / gene_product=unspecified product / transcript_product=unspecified product / location=Mono_scaffold00326:51474-52667(+) / protein_length=398 / sequence_SO=supercontig / SO=protein_coding / is_pseudo=false